MDANLLQEINGVVYYVDEYKKGNPDYNVSVMKTIAKETKSQIKHDKFKLIYRKIQMSYIKLRILLSSYETIVDERFIDLSNDYLIDLTNYMEYLDYLKNYLNDCIKNKEYDTLDDAYLLSVKISVLIQQLDLYLEDICKVLKENTASYRAVYPKNDYTEMNIAKEEVDTILMKLKKDPE